MLYLTQKDQQELKVNYQLFLENLKIFLNSHYTNNPLEIAATIIEMLNDCMFSIKFNSSKDDSYKYLSLPNMPSEGVQVMTGRYCCRHANTLLYDILQTLQYDCYLQYIMIDETNNWHLTTASEANHVAVILKYEDASYLLDSYNNYILKISTDNSLIPLNFQNLHEKFKSYSDNNITNIAKILTKYYKLQDLGIDNIYD